MGVSLLSLKIDLGPKESPNIRTTDRYQDEK